MDSSGPPIGYEQDDEGDDKELDQEPIVIPVRDRSKSLESFSIRDGVTMIHVKQAVVCEICSETLTSMARLERHQQKKHGDTRSFCCPVCGVSKDSARKLQMHQRGHKTTTCPKCHFSLQFAR